jgi:uncharacterized protein
MKTLRLIIPLLLLLAVNHIASAQNLKKVETYYDPYTKTRIHETYTTISSPPYARQGVYKEWDQSGVLMTEASFQNGKKHGPFKVFINAGMASIYGKDNVGKVYSISNYANDELNGVEQMYDYTYKKPQVILQKTWVKGQQTKEEAWYENGKPKSISVSSGVSTAWYPNGNKINEITMKDGVENGKVTEWYESGKTAFTAIFKDGRQVGESTVYYEDGTPRKKMNYDPTTYKDMHTIEYYPSGKVKWDRLATDTEHYIITSYDSLKGYKLMEQGWMDDPRSSSGNLLPHGKCTEYNEDGSIIEERLFENGSLNGKVQTLSSDGKIVLQGEYKQNKKVGEWLYYLREDGTKTN